jgi:hypothetical protein
MLLTLTAAHQLQTEAIAKALAMLSQARRAFWLVPVSAICHVLAVPAACLIAASLRREMPSQCLSQLFVQV